MAHVNHKTYAPNVIPSDVGEHWINTATEEQWISKGTNSLDDWSYIKIVTEEDYVVTSGDTGHEFAMDLTNADEITLRTIKTVLGQGGQYAYRLEFFCNGAWVSTNYCFEGSYVQCSNTFTSPSSPIPTSGNSETGILIGYTGNVGVRFFLRLLLEADEISGFLTIHSQNVGSTHYKEDYYYRVAVTAKPTKCRIVVEGGSLASGKLKLVKNP
jgi:hypothetical protein